MGVSADNVGSSTDGQCSSPLQSSEDDDNVSDEDFRLDEAELHTVYSSDPSENSRLSSSYVSENEGKRKKKSKSNKINERVLDEEIQSSDEHDDEYLQFLRCLQGENAEIFSSSVNVGKRKTDCPRKDRSPRFMYEADDRDLSDNHNCSKNGSFTQSSRLPYSLNSKSGATEKGGRLPKITIKVINSESEEEKDSIGEFAKSENGGSRKRGRLSHFEDINDGDELYLEWLRNLELSGRCESGGNRKQGRPPKEMNLGVGALRKSENGSSRKRGRLPHFEDINDGDELYVDWLRSHGLSGACGNAGNRKRGRPEPENDGEPMNGGYRKRGRPPKKTIIETESQSQSENDLVWALRKSENGGNRERGKGPQFEDIEDGDEMYLRGPRNPELSARSDKGDNSKRGRPQKGMNVGGCRRSRRLQEMSRK